MKEDEKMKHSGYGKAFRAAFPYTIPVLTGYLFIGIAFGVMYQEKGYNFIWAALMSILVYAGSGQYLAVNFFAPGVSFLSVIFMTFMVKYRNYFKLFTIKCQELEGISQTKHLWILFLDLD